MGRRENPIAPCDKALHALAQWLRDRREEAGLNYTQPARRTERVRWISLPQGESAKCSADTLLRAASGARGVPRRKAVLAYAAACGANLAEADRLWKQARYRQAQEAEPLKEKPKHITYVRDFADLHLAMVELYRTSGCRSCQELEDLSGQRLKHSTIWRVLNEQTGRPSRSFVVEFAQACGLRGIGLRDWAQAWDRAEERRTGDTSRNRRGPVFVSGRGAGNEVYLDRGRHPGGQEVWKLQTKAVPETVLEQRMEEIVLGHRVLSPADLAAARSIMNTQRTARALSRKRASGAAPKSQGEPQRRARAA
ncbi:helix-turn-helix domain-containing protein [Streptomyces sp. NBC_01465]|uniref:helix-turn-helix domain-containing protein n=1 Tax=Streptomyces sp. NBC_01465 TaxID=2903878 RepID=UPI002E3093FF|nr:helix-turn-helix transcriptional regulator [Streptomyces sp. NBC_01465]